MPTTHEPTHEPSHEAAHQATQAQAHEAIAPPTHPIGLYLKVWLLLFVLSAFSYLVDYFQLHGYLRWSLILGLMLCKAVLIVAVFMHLAWERLALIYTILLPPLCILVLVTLMATEANYVYLTRLLFFR